MQHYQATAAPKRVSARVVGFMFAGLLQAGFVWALVAGLDIKDIGKVIVDPFKVVLDQEPVKPRTPPVTVKEVEVDPVIVPVPTFDIETPRGPDVITATGNNPPAVRPAGPGDHGPVSLAATHTIPPYPAIDIRLGNQGTVLLRLLIGPDGQVQDAKILRSSGSDGLDRAAQAWVMRHWRYQPAMRGGAAVQGAVDVAVKFDLKNAG